MIYFESFKSDVGPLNRDKVVFGLNGLFHATYIQTMPAR
jgi:hypothetical protein